MVENNSKKQDGFSNISNISHFVILLKTIIKSKNTYMDSCVAK